MGGPLPHTISQKQYADLPPVLQRKCFSTVERLRLKDASSRPHNNPSVYLSRTKSIVTSSRPRSLLRLDSLVPAPQPKRSNSTRTRLSRKRSAAKRTLVNPETAAWFASLPPAVRRKHFTKEEQILYAHERHSIVLDAADELLQRRSRPKSSPGVDWLEIDTPSRPPSAGSSYFSALSEQDLSPQASQEHNPSTKMAPDNFLDTLSWLDDDQTLDLRLDDYHTALTETALRQAAPPPRHSYRRNMSLTSVSLRRSSVSSSRPRNVLSRSATPSMQFNQLPSPLPPSPRRHLSRPSVSSIDPSATHYRDPTARMKLRVYLGSASKFDEALEFGFPSIQDRQSHYYERPKTSPRLTRDSGRTFFADDTPSLCADDVSSHGDIDTALDPRTPEDAEFRINHKSNKSSTDRSSVKPHIVRPEPYAQATTLDRDMTMHLTLTRPDLRSPSDQRPSTSYINSRPLQQPELPPATINFIWDSLPIEESKMKKFWKKLKLR